MMSSTILLQLAVCPHGINISYSLLHVYSVKLDQLLRHDSHQGSVFMCHVISRTFFSEIGKSSLVEHILKYVIQNLQWNACVLCELKSSIKYIKGSKSLLSCFVDALWDVALSYEHQECKMFDNLTCWISLSLLLKHWGDYNWYSIPGWNRVKENISQIHTLN